MGISHIDNPEVGRTYLIRRKINGNPSVRFQPAKVEDVRVVTDPALDHLKYNGTYLKVRWLDTYEIQEDLLFTYGSVKELTERWVSDEYARANDEVVLAQARVDMLYTLRRQLWFSKIGV